MSKAQGCTLISCRSHAIWQNPLAEGTRYASFSSYRVFPVIFKSDDRVKERYLHPFLEW